MKLNWANSSPIKPWKPHGKKRLVLPLKSKILSILNMGAIFLKIIWAFRSQWRNRFAIWNYDAKVSSTPAIFYFSTIRAFMEGKSMENVGGKLTSVGNKLTSDQCIKKMLFHLIGPP
jgi:hypothetical protein